MGKQLRGGKGASWRTLGGMVPADHILRRIDRLFDVGELRDAPTPHCSGKGRPSILPELLIRMALIGRLYAIPSVRRLCEEVRFNLAYRWFCRLPLDARVPHHSTFSKNRHGRFRDAGVFRLLFEQTVRRCVGPGWPDMHHAQPTFHAFATVSEVMRSAKDRRVAGWHGGKAML